MDIAHLNGEEVPFRLHHNGYHVRLVKQGKKWGDGEKIFIPGGTQISLDCSDLPSLTVQSEKDACDVNLIVRRIEQGQLTPADLIAANTDLVYADVSDVGDYREVVDRIHRANEIFMKLPAATRAAFDNDTSVFLDQIAARENPEVMQKLVGLGLFEKIEEVIPPPVKVHVVADDVKGSQV